MGINVLSEFDGISCGQLALQRTGIVVDNYFASEIDKYAIKITQKNFPNTIQLGSVTEHKSWKLPKIDLLIGGSPCQGFSNAGRGENFDDPRSRLFFEYVNTLRDLQQKNPEIVFLLENVRMKQVWQDVISKYLGVKPVKINSALVSAQNRVRLYWTNIEGITQPEDKHLYLKDIIEYGDVDREKSYTIDANYFKGGNPRSYFDDGKRQLVFEHQSQKRAMVKVGMASDIKGMDIVRRVYSSCGKSPTLSTMQGGHREPKVALDFDYYHNLYLSEKEIEEMKIKKGAKTFSSGKSEGAIQFPFTLDRKSQCLLANGITGNHRTTNVLDDGIGYRKLTPLECERLQTLPDGYTEGVSNTQRYKGIGNGWTVDVVAHIFSFLPKRFYEPSHQ